MTNEIFGQPLIGQTEQVNTTVNWFRYDSLELFEKRKPEGYDYDSIVYKFNDRSFRMPKNMSDIAPGSNMFLGDSNCLGIGVNLEDTWSFKLNKHLGGEFVNLGATGASSETVYRLAKYWIPILKPARVIIWEPPKYRVELFNGAGFTTLGSWTTNKLMKQNIPGTIEEHFYIKNIAHNEWDQPSRARSHDAIRFLQSLYDIDLIFKNNIDWDRKYFGEARDGLHSGPAQHDIIVREFIEEFDL